jgi:DNA primase
MLTEVAPPGITILIHELGGHSRAAQYLMDRGYDLHELGTKYKVSFCIEADQKYGLATGRIVIPIIMDGKLVGWQCRYPADLNWSRIPKYYSRPNMPKRLMLYNFDNAVKSDYVVICEGPIDVWSVGDAGVAIMGKTLSEDQCMRIHANWSGGAVVVMLDGDAQDEMLEIMTRLNNFDGPVIPCSLPADKDPGDFSSEWLANHIRSCAEATGIQLDKLVRKPRHDYDRNAPRYCGLAPEDRPTQRAVGSE